MFIEYILALLLFIIPLYLIIRNRRKKSSSCDCASKSVTACQSCNIPPNGHFHQYIEEKYPKQKR